MNQNFVHILIIALLAINTLLLLNHTSAVRHEAFANLTDKRAAAAAIQAAKPNVQSTANKTAAAMVQAAKPNVQSTANRTAAAMIQAKKEKFTNEYFEDDDEY